MSFNSRPTRCRSAGASSSYNASSDPRESLYYYEKVQKRDARFRNTDEVIGFLSRKFYQSAGTARADTTGRLR